MPELVTIEGQSMVKITREEVFGYFLSIGRGEAYAEEMTRSLMSRHGWTAFGEVEQFKTTLLEKKLQEGRHTTSFAQEQFLKAYITSSEDGKEHELQVDFDNPITIKPEKEKKPLPKWCGGRQSWRKKKKKWREGKCRTTE